jgi:hypothetical protein
MRGQGTNENPRKSIRHLASAQRSRWLCLTSGSGLILSPVNHALHRGLRGALLVWCESSDFRLEIVLF